MKSDVIKSIAFIMDGNGRWATARKLPRLEGHKEGITAMKRVARQCRLLNIPYVSFYAFSTENKKRPIPEVKGLISLMEKNMTSLTEELLANNYKLNIMGDLSYFGNKLTSVLNECVKKTEQCTFGTVNVALNYGARDELERASLICKEKGGKLADHLYTVGQPDPDVLIRTGGEKRLSNFMLYQLAYTELFFSDTYWPDFSIEELNSIVDEYHKRDRRFGK